ncbi:MAG: glycoside hydrolase, partial [Actinobacteria bacterium]|nr:glycoside hydrolase [Actinomycetota bacterium]
MIGALVGAALAAPTNALAARASAEPRLRVLPELPVTAVRFPVGQANTSPAMAADPRHEGVLALASRVDGPEYSCALHLSGDGGRLWVPARPVPLLPAGAEKCFAPEIAFDKGGRLYFLFVGLHTAGNTPMGVFLTSSGDGGRRFAVPHRVLGPDNFAVRMAIDAGAGRRGRIHLVWLHAGAPPSFGGLPPVPNPVMAAHSDDGGRSFSAPVQVSDPGRQRVVAPALALGPRHKVVVAYYDLQRDAVDYQGLEGPTWEDTWSVVVATSGDGGRNFAAGSVVADDVVPPERVMLIFTMAPPALAAGPSGRLYAAWADGRSGDSDVLMRSSADAGRSWRPSVRLNDDPAGNGRTQYLPRLAVAPGGRVDAIFYDRRADPADLRNQVFYT